MSYILLLALLFQVVLGLATPCTTSTTKAHPLPSTASGSATKSGSTISHGYRPSETPVTCTCPNNSSNTLFPGNGNSTSKVWTGPNWASFNSNFTEFEPIPDPEPIPRSITDPAVIKLVSTTQQQLLIQYDALGVISCFLQGSTPHCKGPWLGGSSWNNVSLASYIKENTVKNHNYYCSSDRSYLSKKEKVFYGFTAANITDSLQSISHSASVFAATTCTYNSSCNKTYKNDTEQMYYDFRHYVDMTFFKYMKTALKNNTKSYCPNHISGSASMFTIPTTPFDGGKEYFGLHDILFSPGVAGAINGTVEEGKKELNNLIGNNGRKTEGVFLNMIFFTHGSSLGLSRRDVHENEEIYPGCKRKNWIIDGELQVLEELSHTQSRDIIVRDAACDNMKISIQNSILNFQTAKALFDDAIIVIAAIPTIIIAAEAATGVAVGGVAFAGGFGIMILMCVAACSAYENCDGWPPALVAAAKAVMGKLPANAGVSALLALLARDGSKLAAGLTAPLIAGTGIGFLAFAGVSVYGDFILDAAVTYNKGALACCGDDCSSAICQQAARGCLLFTGSFWAGSEGKLNCGAE